MGFVYLIGLTGGIAAGKSVVAAQLAELGAVLIDADKVAREVVQPGTPANELIVQEFGTEILTAERTIDRAALGAIVFADEAKLARLNAITHPAVKVRAAELIDAADAADPNAIVVYDVPLLVEASVIDQHPFDLIVVVHADQATRKDRLIALRGYDHAEAAHRVNSQASDSERLAVADVVIDSGDSIESTMAQARSLFRTIAQREQRSV